MALCTKETLAGRLKLKWMHAGVPARVSQGTLCKGHPGGMARAKIKHCLMCLNMPGTRSNLVEQI